MRYVPKAVPGVGWRIGNTEMKRWWGEPQAAYPAALLHELNGPKRPAPLMALARQPT
ncbi:hypothetical protein [Deinococcus maricopensis]|uniref:Uncharacterized protein n=1 Tax=Deinococcus maricopensis (strain DSM 21211 / LMG 22137 / NRRL B-23946 / LB-34) TaxID=709986 RepID=E8U5X2_DEIML|nr:hypothetical protein [Deinococcus maricopensis]ADV66461.1 hypothetical protein Deima_0806 [Deinococcus maricopensis DSM 21211]